MKNILETIKKEFFVKLGSHRFSPLMELSGGIVLDYCKNLKLDQFEKMPLILCFPQKRGAALWTSILLLTNAFLEDYINNEVDGIEYKKGDKVKLYNCICEIVYISEDRLELKFKDQTFSIYNSNNTLKRVTNAMSLAPKSRALNNLKKFSKGKKQIKKNRNPISKILIPDGPEIINQNNLDSKVLLISGRGNIKAFYELLDNSVFYEEKLSKIFGLDKNLIIKPDLKPYIHFFSDENKSKRDDFKKALISFSKINSDDAFVEKSISSFLDTLNNEDGISEDFDNDFRSFIEEYEEEFEKKLEFIMEKFPGVQESLPTNLKAVILNDINQINEYPETIKGFLALGIPVVVCSNRNISNVSDIEFYNHLFNNNPDYYRVNWNRKKILDLIKCSSESKFIDEELWKQSKRYASQQIKINVTEGCELDVMIRKLQSIIKELDEYEKLQKAFYKYFYPALYALKNSKSKTAEITHLISEFKYIFDGIKRGGLPESTIFLIEKGIRIAYDFESNSKDYDSKHNIFSNQLPTLDLKNVYIPCEIHKTNLSTSNKSILTFTGYPYQEYSGKFLVNSVCVDFIPEVEILCWPNEGDLTYKYLKRRLIAGYFTDNLIRTYDLTSKFLLTETIEFEKEVESFLQNDSNIQVEQEQETDLEYLHTFKYKGYGVNENEESIHMVRCNRLNFRDESFMFLPKKSSIMAETESKGNNIKVTTLKFSKLSPGLRIFKYQKDRALFKNLSKKNIELKNAYENLEIWSEKLQEMFYSCNKNVSELSELLINAKDKFGILDASPTKANLRNWLYDENMIMPDHTNVKLILTAAFDSKENIDNKVNNLRFDNKLINADRIKLSTKINKTITQQFVDSRDILDGEIDINIEGIKISVDVKTIESLDQSDIEIEYHHTRKILC